MAIYFFHDDGENAVKIGYSFEPRKRFRRVQANNPRRIRILAIVPGERPLETKLHRQFAEWRIHHEWFRCCPELMDFIKRLKADPALIASVDSPNVWAQCCRRDGCRSGLGGLRMKHVPTSVEFVCDGSEWGENRTLFVFDDSGYWDPGFDPDPDETRIVICASEYDLNHYHQPRRLLASECELLSSWPVTCCAPED